MPNLTDFDRLYRRTIKQKADVADPFRLKLDRVDPAVLRVLTHVTVENQTTTGTKTRLGINAGGRDHYLDEIQDPAQNELCVSRSDILLAEGDYFFAEFTDIDDGDVLIMTCIGWEKDLK